MLWGRDEDDEPFFLWNSLMAESNNSMVAREDDLATLLYPHHV